MVELIISIEISGTQRRVGMIRGDSYEDARFQYAEDYRKAAYAVPISISLPLQEEAFAADVTRNFFEGLLPEGFSRRAVAEWIKTDENDYVTILSVLGRECLGAIKVTSADEEAVSTYEKLSIEQVKALAAEGATKSTKILMDTHLSLTGASGKAGLYYDKANDEWYLPIGDAPSTHIVKQSHIRLSDIVINEQLCMLTARKLGIDVPDSFIINTGEGKDSDILYATARYDRCFRQDKTLMGLQVPNRLHQEDFAQALGIKAADKYEKTDSGYLRRMFELVRRQSSEPIADMNRLWKLIRFNYLIGNTDCHIKNYSLLYSDDLKGCRMAPAYDLVSTGVYGLTGRMSFYIGGECDIEKLDRSTFQRAAKEAGLPEKQAWNILDELAETFGRALDEATEELVGQGYTVAEKVREGIRLAI